MSGRLEARTATLPDGKTALVQQDPDEEPLLNEDGTVPKPPEPSELPEIPVPDYHVELPVLTIEPGEHYMAINNAKPTDPGARSGEYREGDGTPVDYRQVYAENVARLRRRQQLEAYVRQGMPRSPRSPRSPSTPKSPFLRLHKQRQDAVSLMQHWPVSRTQPLAPITCSTPAALYRRTRCS